LLQYLINNHAVTFDPGTHTYYVDQVPVVNIGTLVDTVFPRNTAKVDPEILMKAAAKGQALKDMIIRYEQDAVKTYDTEMQSYLNLKRQHQFDVLENDVIVLLHQNSRIVAAGSVPLILTSPYMKATGLAVIKRAAHIDMKRLKLQLNLYKLAYEQTYRKKLSYLKCVHIRGYHHTYLDVPVDTTQTKIELEKFLEEHSF